MNYRWLIDGVGAGLIMGPAIYQNGQYSVDFSRNDAALEQIEGINWTQPTIEYVGFHGSEPGLPKGYGFDVVKIEYLSNTKTYRVHLKTASQYLGDVTGYQAQITELEAVAAEKDSTITAQVVRLAESEGNLAATSARLAESEGNLAATSARLAESEGNLAAASARLAESERNLAAASAQLAESEENLAAATAQLAELEAAYDET